MTGWTDNVVLTRAASEALCGEFIGWQCRLRQLAARESGGHRRREHLHKAWIS
jgi:hypothetical protein